MKVRASLERFPFIAILRGIQEYEIYEAGSILIEAGFEIIEIPLNSPNPIKSLQILTEHFGSAALIGAGTVLTESEVDQVHQAGGNLVVCPNCDENVIKRARSLDLICLPGVMTPTEAFTALRVGADGLKLFPAELLSPSVIKAMKAVLPAEVIMIPVGGINDTNWKAFHAAGASGFGLGSSLYRAGMSMSELRENAQKFKLSWITEQLPLGSN